MTPVEIGVKDDQGIEIKSGLNEGDRVVLTGASGAGGGGTTGSFRGGFPGGGGAGGGLGGGLGSGRRG